MKRNVSSPTQRVRKAWLRTVLVLGVSTATVSSTPVPSQQTLSPDEVRIGSKPYQPRSQVLRSEIRLVEIEAVVRDDNGRIVAGLKPEDFAVLDDGKKQTISTFQVETHTPVGVEGMNRSSAESRAPAPQVVTARPRYVALYFDDLHTKWGDMKHAQAAAKNFILHGLDPQDRVAVATSSSTVTLDFTSDASKMLDAIDRLQSHIRVFDSLSCPRITGHDAYLIVNFPTVVDLSPTGSSGAASSTNSGTSGAAYSANDAFQVALQEAKQCNCGVNGPLDNDCYREQERLVLTLAKQVWEPTKLLSENTLATIQEVVNDLASKQGERVLVLASSGFLAGTIEDQVDAIMNQALRQEIVINALDSKGLYAEDPSHTPLSEVRSTPGPLEFKHETESFSWELMAADAAMTDFAAGTGGRFFHDRNDLDAGYYSVAAAPETDYLMGFVPEDLKTNGAFHKLRVEVNGPGKLYVQARPGYFAPSKETKQTSKATPDEKIDAEVRGSDERGDFPLSVNQKIVAVNNGKHELSVQAHVDIQKLPFRHQEDRHANMITFVVALFDSAGEMVTGTEARMQLALKPDTFERFSKTGISGTMTVSAPPGAYGLRVVVQEALRGEISATTQRVQIQ